MPATATPTPGRSAGFDYLKARSWREDRELSREQVCAEVGISASYLTMIEVGLRVPRIEVVIRLADFYGHEPGELLIGSGGGR
jgi:transcriptional regulator with XRE-family HTH domain